MSRQQKRSMHGTLATSGRSKNPLQTPEQSRILNRLGRLTATAFIVACLCGRSALADRPVFESGVVTFSNTSVKLPQRFQLADHKFEYTQRFTKRWGQLVDVFEVSFPSPVETEHAVNNNVACEYFRPIAFDNSPDEHPGVIVLHILGGDFELSRTICRTFAAKGIGSLFLKMPYYGPRRPAGSKRRMISTDLDETVAGMTQAVLDIRRGTAWLAARPDIDRERIGITGISLGGIVGCLAAENEPRLKRGCFVLAGGDLPVIVMESDEMKKVRDANREIDRDRAVKLLSQVDPLTYASALREREVLMFNAKNDNVVPPACTDKLWHQLGKPKIEWWNANHYSAIVYLPKGLVQITTFFSEADWGVEDSADAG